MTVRVLAATLITMGLAATPAFADTAKPHGVNAREARQEARIHHGVKDGQITKGELDHLKADEAAIRAEERVYRKSGQGLNPQERKDLERDLNKSSRQIHRAAHNQRTV